MLLFASSFFLKRGVNYSIYPKKWSTIRSISVTLLPHVIHHTPSIYDFISVAQWIVTIALLTLPNLPVGYRQFASNFGWSTGTGGGINVQAFSNAASNLRKLVSLSTCYMRLIFTASITKLEKAYFPDPTGFESYPNTLQISNNNIFFVMFVALLLAIGAALIITLLIGAVAFKMKEKLKF
jgi:hypothetical protein